MTGEQMSSGFRRAVLFVALANFAYFGIEFAVAVSIGSVSLFADSVDFIEDTSVNLLIFFALMWTPIMRARVGMALSGVLIVPAIAFLWALWGKYTNPVPPEAFTLSLTGLGALAVNIGCAYLLAGFRHHAGSLSRAAFLSARNDALANVAIIAAGLVTAYLWHSIWPDVIVGLAIAAINLDAAREVWEAARGEHEAES